jgi:hypothetical protein
MTVDWVPSSADVTARPVTMLDPDIAKKSVLLVVKVPLNCEPSDIVTLAVAMTVPPGALSGIVALTEDRVIAVGVATLWLFTTNGAVAINVAVVVPFGVKPSLVITGSARRRQR